MAGLFQRLQDQQRAAIEIILDGDKLQVLDGDTLLTAILTHRPQLRHNEIGDEPRAGFCLMGACQDCWVSDGEGNRLRACTTYVREGLEIITGMMAPDSVAAAVAINTPEAAGFFAVSPTAVTTVTKENGGAEDNAADSAEEGRS
jgi:hypothetical protein